MVFPLVKVGNSETALRIRSRGKAQQTHYGRNASSLSLLPIKTNRVRSPLHRAVDIDELAVQSEAFRQVFGQRPHAKAFGRMMPGRDVGHT